MEKCILVISDQHMPYHHPQMMDFLKAIKKKYKPTRIVNIGDELDHHAMSFHDSDPDLPSAGDEHKLALKTIKDITIDTPSGKVYFCHGKVSNITKLVQQYGVSCCSGHYHSQMKIEYVSRPDALTWGLQVGCLVDKDSMAMAYGRVFKDRPIIGTGIIIDGFPKLLPMVLNKGGLWNKVVP
jgi:hypothetical protein